MSENNIKITKRERYLSLCDLLKLIIKDSNYTEKFDLNGLYAFCEKEIDILDQRNEKAKERAAAKRAETDELLDIVYKYVTDIPQTRDDITDNMIKDGFDVTPGKVGYRLTVLSKVDDGRVLKQEASIPGIDGTKPRRVMTYILS